MHPAPLPQATGGAGKMRPHKKKPPRFFPEAAYVVLHQNFYERS